MDKQFFYALVCVSFAILWACAGNHEAAMSWCAAAIVIIALS